MSIALRPVAGPTTVHHFPASAVFRGKLNETIRKKPHYAMRNGVWVCMVVSAPQQYVYGGSIT